MRCPCKRFSEPFPAETLVTQPSRTLKAWCGSAEPSIDRRRFDGDHRTDNRILLEHTAGSAGVSGRTVASVSTGYHRIPAPTALPSSGHSLLCDASCKFCTLSTLPRHRPCCISRHLGGAVQMTGKCEIIVDFGSRTRSGDHACWCVVRRDPPVHLLLATSKREAGRDHVSQRLPCRFRCSCV